MMLHAAAGSHERPTSMFRRNKSESLRSLVDEKVPISAMISVGWFAGIFEDIVVKSPEFGCCNSSFFRRDYGQGQKNDTCALQL